MKKTLILAENLQHLYGDYCAVRDMSFDLKQGDILGLLGPNGAGKSTTMKMLCGVLPLHQGQISLNGFDLLEQPRQAKQQIGYLPEQPPLYNELSVIEYLDYSGRLRHISKNRLKQASQTAMERCGLEQVQNKLIGQLSKGYQQRVGIAQAIIHNPPVIILDEPTVGLDPIQIREIRQLIATLGEEHGVILSTHILPEVQAVCNQIKIIHQGQLVYSDSMEALKQKQHTQLRVQWQRPPAAERLTSLDYVQQLEILTDKQFILTVDDVYPAAEQLASLSTENNWGLVELCHQRQSLENIFVTLTAGDEQGKEVTLQ